MGRRENKERGVSTNAALRMEQKSDVQDTPLRTTPTTLSIQMNINLKLNKVQLEQLKEVMRRDKRPFNPKEIQVFFIDNINRRYVNG